MPFDLNMKDMPLLYMSFEYAVTNMKDPEAITPD